MGERRTVGQAGERRAGGDGGGSREDGGMLVCGLVRALCLISMAASAAQQRHAQVYVGFA